MSTDGTRWLERHQAWELVRARVGAAAEATGWRLTRVDSERARARLHFSNADGATADIWFMAPLKGERAYRTGTGFLYGHGVLPPRNEGSALLDSAFDALESAAVAGELTPLLDHEDAPVPDRIHVEKDGAFDLRLTTACNERCAYCYVDDNAIAAAQEIGDLAGARRLLSEARTRGVEGVVVTGGEPTLMPWLPDVLHAAVDLGFSQLILQTNATMLAGGGLAAALTGIPGLSLFVSLPAHDATTAAAVTGRGDLHRPKVAGIRAALRAGLVVSINHVVCRQNLPHVERFVPWLVTTFDPPPKHLVFSFPLPAGRAREEGERVIPRYREAAPAILAGLRQARAMGLSAHVAGICGLPTCIEPALREFPEPHPETFDILVDPDRVKFPGCRVCPWNRQCPGVPIRYLELYGTGEFAALLANADPKE